jgi:hypothetical protein
MAVVVRVSDDLYIVCVMHWGSASFKSKFEANQYALSLLHAGVTSCVKLNCGLCIPA